MEITRRRILCSLPVALAGMTGVASCLTRAGAALPRARADEAESFLTAVKAGDENEVRRRLAEKPSLAAARDAAGISALLHAHLSGHANVAALLRDTGLELDIVECVFEEQWKRMDELAKRDPAAPNALNALGGNLLYAGALAGSSDLYRMRSLGCDPDGVPSGGTGLTPARIAMDQRTIPGALIAATDLMSNGSSANSPQRNGDSVLHGAVRRRSERLVRLAVRKGADVAAKDDAGRTAQVLARELGWTEGAALLEGHAKLPRDHRASRFLLDANREPVERADLAGVPQSTQNEVTGASHAKIEKLRTLVAKDRRLIWSISTDDELAIEASAHVGNRDGMRLHLDHGAPLSLPTAISIGDVPMVRFLLDRDPRLIHERGAHDYAAMHYAAIGGGGVDLAALLHSRGADVDQESAGLTTLHWSVRRDDPDLTRWLIEKGADIEAVNLRWDPRGQTPLQVALEDKTDRQAKILKDAGAKG